MVLNNRQMVCLNMMVAKMKKMMMLPKNHKIVHLRVQIGQALRPALKGMGFWNSVMELARAYECMMSLVIYMPIVVLSWFPFVSEFQIRLLFNQAFSRGLQISMILAGKKDKRSSST